MHYDHYVYVVEVCALSTVVVSSSISSGRQSLYHYSIDISSIYWQFLTTYLSFISTFAVVWSYILFDRCSPGKEMGWAWLRWRSPRRPTRSMKSPRPGVDLGPKPNGIKIVVEPKDAPVGGSIIPKIGWDIMGHHGTWWDITGSGECFSQRKL